MSESSNFVADVEEVRLPKSYNEIVNHGVRRFLNAFVLGYTSRTLLSIFVRVFSIMRSKNKNMSLNNILGEKNLIVREEAVRLGLFFGSMSGGYAFVKDILEKIRGREDGYNALIAGGISGLSLLTQDPESWRTISLYIFARLIQSVYLALKNRGHFKFTDKFTHGDTVLFALASAQVMYAYVMRPQTLPKSYFDFIVKTGPIHRTVLEAARCSSRGLPIDAEKVIKYCASKGRDVVIPNPLHIVGCDILHPQTPGCLDHNLKVFMGTAKKIMPLYASLTIIPSLFNFRAWLKRPVELGQNMVFGIGRSVTFLAGFVAIYMSVVCAHRKVATHDSKYLWWVAGLLCSTSIMVEKKSRRGELALYVLPRAIDSLYQIMADRKWLAGVKNGELYIFMMSMAGLMYFYENEANTVSPLLTWFSTYLFKE
jgi:hypothetical protein